MKSIERSTDPGVRPSPSVSATVYPRGYRARGNDGRMWEIIVDSRGTHRWKKLSSFGPQKGSDTSGYQPSQSEKQGPSDIEIKTKKQIDGIEMIIEDDPSSKEEMTEILEKKLLALEKLYDMYGDYREEKYGKAAQLIRDYLRKIYKEGGRVQQKKQLFQEALQSGYQSDRSKDHLLKRMQEL